MIHDRDGGPRIVVARVGIVLPSLDAIIVEDDTRFVVGEPAGAEEAALDPEVFSAGVGHGERTPGHAVLRGGRPILVSAIVHDLDRDPTWREEWIEMALTDALAKLSPHNATALAMDMLGVKHGGFDPKTFNGMLRNVLAEDRLPNVRLLWLLAPSRVDRVDLEPLTGLDVDIRI